MYPKLNLTAVSQVRIAFIKTKNKKVWEINNETPEGKICLCLWGEEVLLNIRCLFVFCLLIVVFLCTCCFSCFFCPLFCVLILLAKYSVLHLLSSIQGDECGIDLDIFIERDGERERDFCVTTPRALGGLEGWKVGDHPHKLQECKWCDSVGFKAASCVGNFKRIALIQLTLKTCTAYTTPVTDLSWSWM